MIASFRFYFFMKYIITAFAGMLFFHSNAQSYFQGKIEYNLHAERDKDDASLTIYFGVNTIRLQLREKMQDSAKEYVLINLDSGKIYTVTPGQQQYKERSLLSGIRPTSFSPKDIAGFRTTPVMPTGWGLSYPSFITSLLPNTVLYVADNLGYKIPEKYAGNPELMMVQKGKIVLGAEIFGMDEDYSGKRPADSLRFDKPSARITATAITPMAVNGDLLKVPSGYTLPQPPSEEEYADMMAADSLDSVVSSQKAIDPSKKMPVKKPKKSPTKKKTTAAKSSATRRNER